MSFTTGQTVRWTDEFAGWMGSGRGAEVGRVVTIRRERASCPLCTLDAAECPGPWYTVDYAGHPGLSGLYAEHMLQPA